MSSLVSEHLLYLTIDLLTLAGPLSRAFEPRLRFWRRWPALLLATAVMSAVFIAWDALFTAWGVWRFEPRYLVGVTLGNLPLEECLFFLVVPYACVFTYEVLNHFAPRDRLRGWARPLSVVLALGAGVVAATNVERLYTVSAFGSAALLLLLAAWRAPRWLGLFFRGYAVCLVPFLLVNGVLTGSFIEQPVVVYEDAENLRLRLATIPIEDTAYMLTMLLLTIAVYETLRSRWNPELAPNGG